MRGLELPYQPHPSEMEAQHPQLAELRDQIQERWPELPQPLVLEWIETPLVAVDRSGVPWVTAPAERDPLRDSRGRTVIPRRQRARLKRTAELGIPFQRLAIAHELDPDGPVLQLLPALQRGPLACTEEVARRLVPRVPPHPLVARGVRVLDAAVRGPTAAASNILVSLLDPIVFGVIAPGPPQGGQPCLWYPLAAWRW